VSDKTKNRNAPNPKAKRFFELIVRFVVLVALSPLFFIIALLCTILHPKRQGFAQNGSAAASNKSMQKC
jgi:lipopolysaccharide/colanic/teichoic acid biosynthesis glycosyltransferase